MLALLRIQESRGVESVEKHERTCYFCETHNVWHLTSWTTEVG
jgi:hypothetical protein